jgi:hypothetical protein
MRSFPLLLPALLISGCNIPRVDAPSLLPRPIETRSSAEPVRTVDAAPDAALDAEIGRRRAAFEAATTAFDTTLAKIRPMIEAARGDRAGSDAWIAAQAMLTDLGTARAASDSALSELEQLAIARAAAGLPPLPPLDALIEAGNATVAREGDAVAALQAGLAPL